MGSAVKLTRPNGQEVPGWPFMSCEGPLSTNLRYLRTHSQSEFRLGGRVCNIGIRPVRDRTRIPTALIHDPRTSQVPSWLTIGHGLATNSGPCEAHRRTSQPSPRTFTRHKAGLIANCKTNTCSTLQLAFFDQDLYTYPGFGHTWRCWSAVGAGV
jgi:hypothetical protein